MSIYTLKKSYPLLLIVLVFGLASLACYSEGEAGGEPTVTPRLVPNEIRQQALVPDLENEAGYPEIILTFKEQTYGDLPVYRATLSYPLIVNTTGPGPWVAEMVVSRSDDLQKLGGLQPGTVIQEAVFMGTYDPNAGTLNGSLTHSYSAHQLATQDYLESQQTADLVCDLAIDRVPGTDTMQGDCTGSISRQTVVPSDSSLNQLEKKAVMLIVSCEIPPDLLVKP